MKRCWLLTVSIVFCFSIFAGQVALAKDSPAKKEETKNSADKVEKKRDEAAFKKAMNELFPNMSDEANLKVGNIVCDLADKYKGDAFMIALLMNEVVGDMDKERQDKAGSVLDTLVATSITYLCPEWRDKFKESLDKSLSRLAEDKTTGKDKSSPSKQETHNICVDLVLEKYPHLSRSDALACLEKACQIIELYKGNAPAVWLLLDSPEAIGLMGNALSNSSNSMSQEKLEKMVDDLIHASATCYCLEWKTEFLRTAEESVKNITK